MSLLGGLCSACSPAQQPSGDKTRCEACPPFTLSTDGKACNPCDKGKFCTGKETAASEVPDCSKEGYIVNPCAGDSCVEGYSGYLCSECARGFYLKDEIIPGIEAKRPGCAPCSNAYGLWIVLAVCAFLLLFAVILLLRSSCELPFCKLQCGLRLRNRDCTIRRPPPLHMPDKEKERMDKERMETIHTAMNALWTRCVTLSYLNSIPCVQSCDYALPRSLLPRLTPHFSLFPYLQPPPAPGRLF